MQGDWKSLGMEGKIRNILKGFAFRDQDKYPGYAFATAYQIALEFECEYPEETKAIDKPTGGLNTGKHDSLAKYISDQLSTRIRSGEITDMEHTFVHTKHMSALEFRHEPDDIEAVRYGQTNDVSLYRLIHGS
jgi:hypothetical protein